MVCFWHKQNSGEGKDLEATAEQSDFPKPQRTTPQLVPFSTDPPYISDTKNTGVPVGQKGILQCDASAVPSAEFQWYKDDKRYMKD